AAARDSALTCGRPDQCPLWVISGHLQGASGMSALPSKADMPSASAVRGFMSTQLSPSGCACPTRAQWLPNILREAVKAVATRLARISRGGGTYQETGAVALPRPSASPPWNLVEPISTRSVPRERRPHGPSREHIGAGRRLFRLP